MCTPGQLQLVSADSRVNEKSDTPESETDTSDSGNGVHVDASDLSSSQTETTTQRLSGPPWSLRRDLKGAVRQQCPGECAGDGMCGRRTILRRRIQDRNPSPQVPLILRGYIKCQNVSRHGMVQTTCSDCSRTDPLPLGSGRLVPAGHDTPAGNPPAEMNICSTPDNLQIEMSAMSVKMADRSHPAEGQILTDLNTLQTELSVMTVTSESVMFGRLASDDDPEDRSSDVGDEAGVFQDRMPTVVSVRPEVTKKWMDRFVVDLVERPSVSRTSIPLLSLLGGGGAVADAYPLLIVESDSAQVSGLQLVESDTAQVSVLQLVGSDTARVSVLPVVSSPPFFGEGCL